MPILALDVGTTHVKAQVFDDGAAAASPVWRRRVAHPEAGAIDPEALGSVVDAVVDDACAAVDAGAAPRPEAVGVACAWHGLVGLDAAGRPTTPLSTWQDHRAVETTGELAGKLPDPTAARRRTGAPLHPSFPAARLWWWASRRPDVAAATSRWCSLGELLEHRWLGPGVGPSWSMASATGCFDQEAGRWDDEVLAAAGIRPGSLLLPDDGPRPPLVAAYRRRWPALVGVPWMPPVGDGAAALMGTAATPPGAAGRPAALSVGTTAAVRVTATAEERHGRPPALFAYLVDRDRVVLGGARSNAGNLLDWAGRVLRLDDPDPVAGLLRRRPGAARLVADPALAGERSPDWPLAATGALRGLRPTTSAGDILAALVEAAAVGVARCIDALDEAAGPLALVCSGGAVRASPAWAQLLADAAGRTLWRSSVEEPSARGAAVVALERLGRWDPRDGVPPAPAVPVAPDRERAGLFAAQRRPG